MKVSAGKYICDLVIAVHEEHELEDQTEKASKSYGCKSTLPLKLEALFKGIILSDGTIFYFLLTEHIKKQITAQCDCELAPHCVDLSMAI